MRFYLPSGIIIIIIFFLYLFISANDKSLRYIYISPGGEPTEIGFLKIHVSPGKSTTIGFSKIPNANPPTQRSLPLRNEINLETRHISQKTLSALHAITSGQTSPSQITKMPFSFLFSEFPFLIFKVQGNADKLLGR